MYSARFFCRPLALALLTAASSPSHADQMAREALTSIKRVMDAVPLTDPRAVFDALGLNGPFHASLYATHVRIVSSRDLLKGTPYEYVDLTPFVARAPSVPGLGARADSSMLSIHFKEAGVCVTRAEVIAVFGQDFRDAPLVATDGMSGNKLFYQTTLPGGQERRITFSFFRPERCASHLDVYAPIS